jgi:hypothetical protein
MFKARKSNTLTLRRIGAPKARRAPSASFSRDGFAAAANIDPDYYKSEAWINLKESRKRMDGYRCQKCGATTDLQVHHIRSRSRQGADTIGNLQTLCETCHADLHPHMHKKG